MGDEATSVTEASIATIDRYAGLFIVLLTARDLSVGLVRNVGSVRGWKSVVGLL